MQVFCIRIGNVNPAPIDKRRPSIRLSPRDPTAELYQDGALVVAGGQRLASSLRQGFQ